MVDKKELYQACKWQVKHFGADTGWTLVSLWRTVNLKTEFEYADFWRNVVLEDYRKQYVG